MTDISQFDTMRAMTDEKLMNLEQVAEYLGLSMTQVYAMNRKGELPTIMVTQKGLRVKPSDLDKWLEERKVHPK